MTENVEPAEIADADLDETLEDTEASATTENIGEDQNTETDESGEADTKKDLNGFDKRVSKLTKRAKEAEFEANYWKQKALEASDKPAVGAREPAQEKRKPVFSDSNDIEIYAEQVAEWTAQKAVDRALQERDSRRNQEKSASSFDSRVNEFRKSTPDYDEVLSEIDVQIAPEIVQTIGESDVGPAIAYYLAKNIDLVEKLNKLPPLKRLLELGKIEDKLQSGTKTPATKKEISKAPVPNKPVQGKTSVTQKKYEEMTPEEFIKARNAADRSRR